MRQLLKNTFTLAVALVFTAGMAFGQTSGFNAEVQLNQVGEGNEATVTQTVNDFADIDQEGGAEAFIFQGYNFNGDSNGKGPNEVDLDQVGNAYADIHQNRGKGDANLSQEGNTYTEYYDFKKGDLKGYDDGTANQVSHGAQSKMLLDFNNAYGKARVDQYGENNLIDVTSGSQASEAKIRQGTESNMSPNNTAIVSGLDFVDISQTGAGSHYADVMQNGSGSATITQSGLSHRSVVTQTGGSSTATITQTGTAN
jgi:hypothetical protein